MDEDLIKDLFKIFKSVGDKESVLVAALVIVSDNLTKLTNLLDNLVSEFGVVSDELAKLRETLKGGNGEEKEAGTICVAGVKFTPPRKRGWPKGKPRGPRNAMPMRSQNVS